MRRIESLVTSFRLLMTKETQTQAIEITQKAGSEKDNYVIVLMRNRESVLDAKSSLFSVVFRAELERNP